MSSRVIPIWLWTSLIASVVAAPFLAQGDQTAKNLMTYHADQISRLSESQRARLRQNEAVYRASTPEEQAAYHALHLALEKDRKSGHGELNALLKVYEDWRKTLTHYQREQLDNAASPADRIALMKEIVHSQQENAARRSLRGFGPGDRPRGLLLSEKSLSNLFQAIETHAAPRFSEEQKAALANLQGFRRHVQLLKLIKEANGLNAKPLLREPPPSFKEVAANIDQYIDDQRVIEFIHGRGGPPDAPPPPSPDWGSRPLPEVRLAEVLNVNLGAELFRIRRTEQRTVDVGTLQKFLESLPPDRQFELLALDALEFQSDLKNEYLDSTGQKDRPGFQDLAEIFGNNFFGRGGPGAGPGGPGGPPNGFREFRGRGRPGDDRRPDRNPDLPFPSPDGPLPPQR